MTSKSYLRRYTDLPSLIDILHNKRITLLDPKTWDDSNDSYFLSLYKERSSLKTVLALCLSQAKSETYHHWKIFSNSSNGICIRFNREKLEKALLKQNGIKIKNVTYLGIQEIRKLKPKNSELPFIKRAPFKDEKEIRVLFESHDEKLSSLNIPLPLECIERITLSPWLHPNLSTNIKAIIKNIHGCSKLNVFRSTIIGNTEWKSLGNSSE